MMNFKEDCSWIKDDMPEEYKENLKKAYEAGYEAGKETGYQEGYSDKEDELNEDELSYYNEGYEVGYSDGRTSFAEIIGYETIRRIQDKTQYQLCYGNDVNVDELIEAIKKLGEEK